MNEGKKKRHMRRGACEPAGVLERRGLGYGDAHAGDNLPNDARVKERESGMRGIRFTTILLRLVVGTLILMLKTPPPLHAQIKEFVYWNDRWHHTLETKKKKYKKKNI